MLTLHGAPAELWEAGVGDANYVPEAFARDGFIHTTVGATALAGVLNRFYRDDARLYVALLIDLDRVSARWDVARYAGDPALYPHIHGPLERAAVVAALPIPRSANGEFLPPALPAA